MLGAVLSSPFARLVPVGMILLALQKTLFVEITPFGVIIQVLMAFAAAAGVAGGSQRGAVAGFIVGLMFDLAVGSPLGSSSITMGLAGFVAGSVERIRIEATWWIAAAFVAVGAGVGELTVPVVRRFIGEEEAFVADVSVIVVVVAVAAAVLSVVFVPLGRWSLRIEQPEWKLPRNG